ncbi:MAG: nucleotide exchange factor GrpE [Nitrososphaeraceae archaeon]
MGLEDSNIKEGSEEEKQNKYDELDVGRPVDNDDKLDNKVELFQLREDLRKARDSADDSLNKLRYMVADFDNYRKQTEKQVSSKIEASRAEILLKFLNIRDDYLRALNMIKHDNPDAVIIEGLQGILKNFDNLLSSEGVVEIESVGTPFDPNIHDALNFSYSDGLPENTVTNEIRKGYMYNNKVLRPSLVEISKKIVKNTVNATETLEKDSDV